MIVVPNGPGPVIVPTAVNPVPKTTVTVELCSALPVVVPLHVIVVPAVKVGQTKPSSPSVVVNTAAGVEPTGAPVGTVAVRVQVMLPTTWPVPETEPLAVQVVLSVAAQTTPGWPLVVT
jgi:hypothetical protein